MTARQERTPDRGVVIDLNDEVSRAEAVMRLARMASSGRPGLPLSRGARDAAQDWAKLSPDEKERVGAALAHHHAQYRRTNDEPARIKAMAEDVGRQLLEERDGEPGFFPYTPDPIAADLIESAFKRGMDLGRRLERQDGGQIAVSWGPTATTGEHDDPPAHGSTGKWCVIALIIGTAGYFLARMIQSGGAA